TPPGLKLDLPAVRRPYLAKFVGGVRGQLLQSRAIHVHAVDVHVAGAIRVESESLPIGARPHRLDAFGGAGKLPRGRDRNGRRAERRQRPDADAAVEHRIDETAPGHRHRVNAKTVGETTRLSGWPPTFDFLIVDIPAATDVGYVIDAVTVFAPHRIQTLMHVVGKCDGLAGSQPVGSEIEYHHRRRRDVVEFLDAVEEGDVSLSE